MAAEKSLIQASEKAEQEWRTRSSEKNKAPSLRHICMTCIREVIPKSDMICLSLAEASLKRVNPSSQHILLMI